MEMYTNNAMICAAASSSRVFQEGNLADTLAWAHALEEETGAVPIWEILFQLMCHPVPQVRLLLWKTQLASHSFYFQIEVSSSHQMIAGIDPETAYQRCPCPCAMQVVKAALDGAIAAFARRPDLSSALWDRLLQSVVVQPVPADDSMMVPFARYDITYQLNEIEVCLFLRCSVLAAASHLQTISVWER